MYDPKISRRTVLRGLGTAMALPLLEAMLPLGALAQSVVKKARPNRMAFMFVPNGVNLATWTPVGDGPEFALMPAMEPLKNVKDSISVLTGLTQQNAFALGDGGGDHARSAATWLTGCHPRKTDGADIKAGISVDQLAAQHIGQYTSLPSLEIGCERGAMGGNCDSGYSCAYSSNISWAGPATPVGKEVDARLVFERLFGTNDPTETAESRKLRERDRQSILDFVKEDATHLKTQLGAHDRAKLDEYFMGVREIEQRLAKAEKAHEQIKQAGLTPEMAAPASYADHIRLLGDMMILAFQADITRVCTFMFANDGSNRSYNFIGVPEGHHDMSHHGHDPVKLDKVRQINTFHITQVAYILEKMKSIKEADGTLLDNSMIVYGAGISDGDAHNHDNLPILLAGTGAGTIKTGRHITYKNGTPMTNLFLAMLDRVGVHPDAIGDSTGRLDRLF
jgi:hypothetical protein